MKRNATQIRAMLSIHVGDFNNREAVGVPREGTAADTELSRLLHEMETFELIEKDVEGSWFTTRRGRVWVEAVLKTPLPDVANHIERDECTKQEDVS